MKTLLSELNQYMTSARALHCICLAAGLAFSAWTFPDILPDIFRAAVAQEPIKSKQPYYDNDFQGAKFIWSNDVKLDNLVLFRKKVISPPDGKERIDFSNLNNIVPEQPPRGDRRGPPR